MITINYAFSSFEHTHMGHVAILELMRSVSSDKNYIGCNNEWFLYFKHEFNLEKPEDFKFLLTQGSNPFKFAKLLEGLYGEGNVQLNFITGQEHYKLGEGLKKYYPDLVKNVIRTRFDNSEIKSFLEKAYEISDDSKQFNELVIEEGIARDIEHANHIYTDLKEKFHYAPNYEKQAT